jgi:putative ABC transport system permease protein
MGWGRFFRRSQWDEERARELESHLEIETDEHIARGMAPDEARYAAERKLGNRLLIREEVYRMNTIGWLDALWQDLRFGLRLLARTPGFTAIAVLSLTLGIGANTAIFQVMDAVRLRALPVSHAEQLVEVRIARPRSRSGNFFSHYAELSNPQWEQIRARQEGFSGVLAWAPQSLGLSAGGEVRKAEGLVVSGNFFEVLGVPAARGRVFADADDRRGCAATSAVISHAFWRREYAGDPAVLGRQIRLDNHLFDIIGVTPPAFFGVEVGRSYDVAIPICAAGVLSPDAGLIDRSYVWWLSVMGRLRPGWTAERATAQLRAISPSLFKQTLSDWFDPEAVKNYLAFRLEAVPCAGGFSSLRAEYSAPLWFLFGLSGLVLLASCVNLANLLLARASARELEIGVRLATGASRGRIVRQLLTESVLLSAIGAAAGVALARGLGALLVTSLSTEQDRLFVDLPSDWRVLGFAIATIVLTTLAFGLAPALRATSRPVQQVMRAGGRGAVSGGRRPGLQGTLVVVQIALSMVMVVSAALFALSLRNLATFKTGHRMDGLMVAELTISPQGTPDQRVSALVGSLMDRLRSTPGVQFLARTAIPPMSGYAMADKIRVERDGAIAEADTFFHHVSPGYFRTVGVPLVAGRDFDDRDRVGSKRVAIVNRTFATTLLKTSSPIGRVLQMQLEPQKWVSYEVVGLVEDAVYRDIREPASPVAHLAVQQEEDDVPRDATLMIYSKLPPSVLKATLVRETGKAGPMIGVELSSLSQHLRDATQRDRLLAALSAGFGGLALALSAIGIYGVLSYLVVRRRQEIGVRMVLGATRGGIIRMVARRSLAWLAIGLTAGGALAVAAAMAMRSMLFGLAPTDPLALAAAGLALGLTGAAATLIPAQRAARLHPTSALRED